MQYHFDINASPNIANGHAEYGQLCGKLATTGMITGATGGRERIKNRYL